MGVKANQGCCVVRGGGYGDDVIASAVLPGLKKRHGFVEVLSQRPQHVVFENNPYVDRLTALDRGDIKPEGVPDWHWIRAKEYPPDCYFNLAHSCEMWLAFFPAQTQFQLPAKARRKLANKSYLEMVADICDVPYDELEPNFFPTEEELTQAAESKEKLGGDYIVWLLRGTRIDKVYPHSPYAVARLLRETGLPVVLLGGPNDLELAASLHDDVVRVNGNADGLHIAVSGPGANSWPMRRALTLAQRAALVIGPDTGVQWAVAMHDLPKIVLLSHASPENITKWWRNTTTLHADQKRVPCWPCHRLLDSFVGCTPNKDGTGAACISDISVEAVVAAAKTSLAPKTNPGANIVPLAAD